MYNDNYDEIQDLIDREYAIKKAELEIEESSSENDKKIFESIIDFLSALPTPEDLEEEVYCNECEHYKLNDDDEPRCKYKNRCMFDSPEEAELRKLRWLYSEAEY